MLFTSSLDTDSEWTFLHARGAASLTFSLSSVMTIRAKYSTNQRQRVQNGVSSAIGRNGALARLSTLSNFETLPIENTVRLLHELLHHGREGPYVRRSPSR